MKLNNGFHFSISNQTIFQTKEIENFYKGPGGTFGLNQNLYKGEISGPVFPSVHAVYKMERFAISFGFYPVGGGGGATYKGHLKDIEVNLPSGWARADLNPSTPSTDVSNKDIIDHNGWSLQAGLEVNLSEKLLVSGGCVFANKGVNSNYQSDLTFGLATRTFGAGGAFKVWDNHLLINFGVSYTQYKKDENLMDHVFSATDMIYQVRQTFNAKTMLFGVGLDFNF